MNPLEKLMSGGSMPPDAGAGGAMPAPSGSPTPGGTNPLAGLIPQGDPQQPPAAPAPTAGQTAAAIHRFSAVRAILMPLVQDPKLGKENIRPKLLDAASKLLAQKVMTLPEIMESVKQLPDDPIMQKKFVDMIYESAGNARATVLDHHFASPPGGDEEPWSQDNHHSMMTKLMEHYRA